ncbi:peptidase S8/S53 domain-containing protein [Aspergillus stella-maris]|uniref:peptidase S8/S53 domain-containing protein n=1 Tax=Aspergillus stella-maris TaxID=1810926 RepID=UPI003CCDFE32
MVSLSLLIGAISLVASGLLPPAACEPSYVVVEQLREAPNGWIKGPAANPSKMMKFHIALRQERTVEFEHMVLDMSTPGHQDHGQHMKRDDVREIMRPSYQTMEQVLSWLELASVPADSIKSQGNWVEATMSVSQAESLMQTKFYRYTNRETHKHAVRALSYSVPSEISSYIHMIQPTTHFSRLSAKVMRPTFSPVPTTFNELTANCSTTMTPDCIRELYGLYDTEAKPDPRNRLGISGYLDQYARYGDLERFMKQFAPNRTDTNFTVISINGGLNLQDSLLPSSEASLDIQYAISLAYDALATYYTTAGTGPFIPEDGGIAEDESTNEPYLEQLHYLLDLPDEELPAVLTTSYGETEQSVPESYSEATCNLFAQLGARGVSVIFSSGDDGPGGSCLTNDGTDKTRFQPIFPASCPFVTSVGGTWNINPERAVDFSGGGFSDRFPRPSYQDASVSEYLDNLGDKWEGLYNPSGRAIPDVAAQANNYLIVDQGLIFNTGGTSASAPVFAAIVSRLNAARLKDGKPRLGFLNPWLYSLNQTGFTDIMDGRSVGCLGGVGVDEPSAGWDATPGWDAVTGLGTPFYTTLVKLARDLAAFPRPLRLVCQALLIGALILIICQTAYVLHTRSEFSWEKPTHSAPNGRPPKLSHSGPSTKWDESQSPSDCQSFPADAFTEDGIQVTLKIGGAESRELLRSHTDGVTPCIPNLLVVSDMGQKLGPFQSHDVLADVIHVLSDEDKLAYQRQREYHYYWDKELQPTKAGWQLDRYKFLAMIEYAYAQNPNAKWYVFFETDTLVLWDNLVQLLGRYKYVDPVYIGSPTPGRPLGTWWEPEPTFFVYGGSGIVLSVTAMENILREDKEGSAKAESDQQSQLLITKYQDMVREDCCGDSVLGWVAAQREVDIQGQWPMFNPTPLHHTPLGKTYWCQPAISFHKSDPIDVVEIWNWQQKRLAKGNNSHRPVLYSDLIDFFDFASVPMRKDWNNIDMDAFDAPDDEAHESFDACKEACHEHKDCYQFTHFKDKCRMSRIIRLGTPVPPEEESDDSAEHHSLAGWDVEKIKKFTKDHACEEVEWPEPSTERIY